MGINLYVMAVKSNSLPLNLCDEREITKILIKRKGVAQQTVSD